MPFPRQKSILSFLLSETRFFETMQNSKITVSLEKKLLENGYDSLEEYSTDQRHADKWLGPERIAELEKMRPLKEKEEKEQPVQLSLFDVEAYKR